MPFDISSAPEVWQQIRMNEIIEGPQGIEVIADNFLVCRFGATTKEAIADHDRNLCHFLDRAREQSLKLNPDKVKLRLNSVPFIGPLLTDEGLAPDPNKVSAIINMPTLTNIRSLQQLLGMAQYLAKFLPQLSAITESLRQLGHKYTEWKWLEIYDKAVSNVKDLICKAPVLHYFDPAIEITLQCDTSDGRLGYALYNKANLWHLVHAGSPRLKRNMQIEKEMLAIVRGCETFDQYYMCMATK